jgi:protein-tyrosine phosphatase
MAAGTRIALRYMRNLVIALVLFIIAGNVAILGANLLARATVDEIDVPDISGVANLAAVDHHLWRGGAPTEAGYEGLAKHGVKTIVDLRAETDVHTDEAGLKSLGLDLVRLPMRDGQAPSTDTVDRFLRVVSNSEGRVYVHCGAGVGRTGTMAASYLVRTGKSNSFEALQRNLAVGPPSLEQISYVAGLGERDGGPPVPLTVMSRVLDGPRRIWVNITHAYE